MLSPGAVWGVSLASLARQPAVELPHNGQISGSLTVGTLVLLPMFTGFVFGPI